MIKKTKKIAIVTILTIVIIPILIICGITFYTPGQQTGFSLRPTVLSVVDGDAMSGFVFEGEPGSSLQDSLTISNFKSDPIKVFLYGADAKESKNEKLHLEYKLENETQEQIGKWISFTQKEVDIDPNSTQKVSFTINIPKETELKDYIGGIAGEIHTTNTQANQKYNANINYRIIDKIQLKVTNDPKPIEKLPPRTLVNPVQAYIYASFALPVIVIGWLVWRSLKERKRRKHAAAGTASHDKK